MSFNGGAEGVEKHRTEKIYSNRHARTPYNPSPISSPSSSPRQRGENGCKIVLGDFGGTCTKAFIYWGVVVVLDGRSERI